MVRKMLLAVNHGTDPMLINLEPQATVTSIFG